MKRKYDTVIPRALEAYPISEALEILAGGALSPQQLKEKLVHEGYRADYSHLAQFLCDFGFAAYNRADGKLYPNRILMNDPALFSQLRENYRVFGSVGLLAHPANYEPKGEFDFTEEGNVKPFRLSYEHFVELTKNEEGRDWLIRTMECSAVLFLTDERFRDSLSGVPLVDFQKLFDAAQ